MDSPAAPDAKRSDWNAAIDRILAEKLNLGEHRFALAVARLSYGFNSPVATVGLKLLRDRTGMQNREIGRVAESLRDKGLLDFPRGRRGKPSSTSPAETRGTYRLILRPAERQLVAVPAAKLKTNSKPKANTKPKKPAAAKPACVPGQPTLQAQAIDAYRSHGGNLEYGQSRAALVRGVKTLSKKGVADEEIIAAAAALGREGEFTGYLAAKVEELREQGGPCKWARMRSGLDPRYLRECGCAGCIEWAEVLEQGGVAA